MKIVVDQLPKSPRACIFSQHHCEYGYLCTLHPCVSSRDGRNTRKPLIRCDSVADCECLVILTDALPGPDNIVVDEEGVRND